MSLLFQMHSRFVIAFLPRSKHLLISWVQSLSAVILEPKKIKYVTVSTFAPSICHEVMGLDAEHIMRNAGLDEAQAGIKIAGRNINNLRCAESEEELKSLLMKVKEESEKAGLIWQN